jgi:hypothetical protein
VWSTTLRNSLWTKCRVAPYGYAHSWFTAYGNFRGRWRFYRAGSSVTIPLYTNNSFDTFLFMYPLHSKPHSFFFSELQFHFLITLFRPLLKIIRCILLWTEQFSPLSTVISGHLQACATINTNLWHVVNSRRTCDTVSSQSTLFIPSVNPSTHNCITNLLKPSGFFPYHQV